MVLLLLAASMLLQASGLLPNAGTYSGMLKVVKRAGAWREACNLIETMRAEKRIPLTTAFYQHALEAFSAKFAVSSSSSGS
jgi:hypothetical protein